MYLGQFWCIRHFNEINIQYDTFNHASQFAASHHRM